MMMKHPLEQFIENYLAEKDITQGSYDLYHTILKQYANYLIDHRIQYATTQDLKNYIAWKKSQGYSTRWIYHQISAIKGLYQYLFLNQKRLNLPIMYEEDISESIKNVHIENCLEKEILTIEQAKQLILSNKENRRYIWHYRDYAILYLMLTTGLRSIEIRRAKRRDLSMINNKPILYIQGKGKRSKDAFVKLSKGVDEAIRDYLIKRKDKNPYLFISYSHRGDTPYLSRTFFKSMFQRVLTVAGLENLKVTPHSLRHTAATINLARGGTLEETKRLMRHSNLNTTLLYSHHLEGMKDDVESAIEQFILSDNQSKIDDES